MKVVHVITSLDRGGAETMLLRLVTETHHRNEVVHFVISLRSNGALVSDFERLGVQVHSLGLEKFSDTIAAFYKLRRLLKQNRPDIVHTWLYHADLLGGLAAKSLSIRNIIWSIRSTDIRTTNNKKTLIIKKINAFLSHYVPKRIICVAQSSLEAHASDGYAKDKMQVIYNGINPESFLSFKSEEADLLRGNLGISALTKIVVSVARFNPVKDHRTLIAAASQVLSKFDDVVFVLVGRGLSKDNSKLNEWIRLTPKPDAFVLLGERTDIPDILRSSDIFCVHSLSEGFPNALAEAMLVGVASVTTDAGDAAYLLNSPEWVTTPGDQNELADTILRLLKISNAERKDLGALASERITNFFTIEKIAQSYIKLYRNLSPDAN